MYGLGLLLPLISALRGRLTDLRSDDRGMTTEAMIITALLAAAALGAVGAIVAAISNRGTGIADDINQSG